MGNGTFCSCYRNRGALKDDQNQEVNLLSEQELNNLENRTNMTDATQSFATTIDNTNLKGAASNNYNALGRYVHH